MSIGLKLPREEMERIVEQVQGYFQDERDEEIGGLAAEQLIAYMIRQLGPALYNRAIADARAMLTDRLGQIDDELYALEKRPAK